MQHYVATRSMFIDVEVMNADTRLVLGDQGAQPSPSNVARGLSLLYKEITGLRLVLMQNIEFFNRFVISFLFLLQILYVKKQQ